MTRATRTTLRGLLPVLMVTTAIVAAAGQALAGRGVVGGVSGRGSSRQVATKHKPSGKELKVGRHLAMAQYIELHEGNLEAAAKEYEAALRLDGKSYPARLGLAGVAQRMGDKARALRELKKLTKDHPNAVDAQLQLGAALADAGDIEAASAAYRRILAREPGHAEAHARVAQILHDRFRKGDATVKSSLVGHLKAYLATARGKRGPRYQLAARLVAELESGELGAVVFEAKSAYEAAWSDGRFQNINGKMARARRGFERCLELAPDNQECAYRLGLVHASVKASDCYDLDKAREMLRKATDVADAHVELAVIARKEGDDDLAETELQRAIALDDTNQRAWLQLGIVTKLAGRDAEAVAALTKAYELDADSSVAGEALGELTILEPDHTLVQSAMRFGDIKGDVFGTEKFKSAVTFFESRFGDVDPDSPQLPVLEKILKRLVDGADIVSPHPLGVAVLRSSMVNAFAMPNGNIYFTEGFFEFMRSTFPDRPIDEHNDALAQVLAHEIVHVLREHVVRSQVFQAAITDASRQLDPAVLTHLTRIHEIQADREGMIIAFLGGYHPRGGVEFMEARGRQGEIPPHLDHPTYDERIHYLEEYWSNHVKFAWLSFSFGLQAMEGAAEAEGRDVAEAAGLYRKAIEDFKRFQLTLRPTKETLNNMGVAYAKLGVYRLASEDSPLYAWNTDFTVERELALRFVAIRRDKTELGRTRGADAPAAATPRELDQAIECFRRALDKDARYGKAKVNLALVYLAKKKYEDATAALATLGAEGGEETARVENLRGVIEAAAGRSEAAFAAFDAATTSGGAPCPAATYNRGLLHRRLDQSGEARAAFEAYLRAAPTGPKAAAARKALAEL